MGRNAGLRRWCHRAAGAWRPGGCRRRVKSALEGRGRVARVSDHLGTPVPRHRYTDMRDTMDRKAKSRPGLGAAMPESLADRFVRCPLCREDYDLRDLGEVLQ